MGLATKWRFPQPLCIANGYHHRPMDLTSPSRELAAVICTADILACCGGFGFCHGSADPEISTELLDVLKLTPEKIEECFTSLPNQVAMAESIFSE